MAADPVIQRYAAFTDDPAGGNPAGVVLDASALDDAAMQAIAADVGYSETAFVTDRDAAGDLHVRYFSPEAEVPFCGHATIATGVAWGHEHGFGALRLHTRAGLVTVDVAPGAGDGPPVATLTSVPPRSLPVAAAPRGVRRCLASRRRGRDARAPGPPRLRLRPAEGPDGRPRLDDATAR